MSPTPGRPSVLLLDDDERILRTRTKLFVAFGMDPVSVSTVEQARSALASEDFNLVIVDVNLSGSPGDRTGLDFVEETVLAKPGIPVAVYSGYYDLDSLPEIEDLGISAWIVKGTSLAQLESQLGALVAMAEAHYDRAAGSPGNDPSA